MKKIHILCFTIVSLFFSCNNEEYSDNENTSNLILKEVYSEQYDNDSPDIYAEKFYYNENGKPEFYEYFRPNTDIQPWTEHYFEYNQNDLLESIFLNITGEPGNMFFEYEDNNLSFISWGIPQPTSQQFNITYEGNTIIISQPDQSGWISNPRTYILSFTDENYDQLVNWYVVPDPEDHPPYFISYYDYDENSNLTSIIVKRYNLETTEYDDFKTTYFTYDNMNNPYKQSYELSPILLHNFFILPAPILLDDKVSSNNVITKIITFFETGAITQHSFEYEYNSQEYPVTSLETVTSNSSSNQQTYSKTYTYY